MFYGCMNFLTLKLLVTFFNWYSGGGVQLGPLGSAATNTPIVPASGDYDDGEIGGMMIGKGNRSTRRKSAPVSLCPISYLRFQLDSTFLMYLFYVSFILATFRVFFIFTSCSLRGAPVIW
jgi:hypothetical protein